MLSSSCRYWKVGLHLPQTNHRELGQSVVSIHVRLDVTGSSVIEWDWPTTSTTALILSLHHLSCIWHSRSNTQITFPPDNELKLSGDQGIKADVDQIKARFFQLRQKPGQVHAVGCHCNGLQALQLPQFLCRKRERTWDSKKGGRQVEQKEHTHIQKSMLRMRTDDPDV